jgi:CDP-diglyceride synthetase
MLAIAGISGGFLLTFWFLVVLLPLTCVAASWIMALTSRQLRTLHLVGAPVLTLVFALWLASFLQGQFEDSTWYGILLIWCLTMLQAGAFITGNRDIAETPDQQPAP